MASRADLVAFETLPLEIWGEVMSHVEPSDVRNTMLVCRTFRDILRSVAVWARVFHNRFGYPLPPGSDARLAYRRVADFQRRMHFTQADVQCVSGLPTCVRQCVCLGRDGLLVIAAASPATSCSPLFFAVNPLRALKSVQLDVDEPTYAAYWERTGVLIVVQRDGQCRTFQRVGITQCELPALEWDELTSVTEHSEEVLAVYFAADHVAISVDAGGQVLLWDPLFGHTLARWVPPKRLFAGTTPRVQCTSHAPGVLFVAMESGLVLGIGVPRDGAAGTRVPEPTLLWSVDLSEDGLQSVSDVASVLDPQRVWPFLCLLKPVRLCNSFLDRHARLSMLDALDGRLISRETISDIGSRRTVVESTRVPFAGAIRVCALGQFLVVMSETGGLAVFDPRSKHDRDLRRVRPVTVVELDEPLWTFQPSTPTGALPASWGRSSRAFLDPFALTSSPAHMRIWWADGLRGHLFCAQFS